MGSDKEILNLHQLLEFLEESCDKEEMSLEIVVKSLGGRSFGFFLLIAGLVTVIPLIGDIPVVPTIMAVFVFLTTVQLFLHNEHYWLPRWSKRGRYGSDCIRAGTYSL